MHTHRFIVRLVWALSLCSAGWAAASPMEPLEAQRVLAEPATIAGFGAPIAGAQLDVYRGGFDVVNNDMQLSGAVTNNSASYIATGNNTIAGGSFTNSNGFPMVIQNSGSNVLIQNATIINLQYQ